MGKNAVARLMRAATLVPLAMAALASCVTASSADEAACLEGHLIRDGRKWINTQGDELPPPSDHNRISDAQFYEVVASRLLFALDDLEQANFKALSDEEAKDFAGSHYRREPSEVPFLTRAVHCGGPYIVSTIGDSLFVTNGTVGPATGVIFRKSALVVNLSAAPKEVHIYAAVEAE